MQGITIKDIAKQCGVSVSTVSRAMNNHPDINKKTKDLIMNAIAEFDYIPNNSARNLKRIEAKSIAILVKGMTNPMFSEMIEVIESIISERKYSVVLRHVKHREDEVDVALGLIKEKRLSGIVFLGGYFYHNDAKLESLGVPYVLSTVGGVSKGIDHNSYSMISIDDEKESFKMTEYLIQLGHKDIALLSAEYSDQSIGKLRLAGYKRALEEYKIPFREELVVTMREDIQEYSIRNGYEVAKGLLHSGVKFTALYAISDLLAIGACRAFVEAGKRIPEDYSVAGFDGIELGGFVSPSITTISQPMHEMARYTINLLFDLIDGKKSNKLKVFPAQLLVRESTKRMDDRD